MMGYETVKYMVELDGHGYEGKYAFKWDEETGKTLMDLWNERGHYVIPEDDTVEFYVSTLGGLEFNAWYYDYPGLDDPAQEMRVSLTLNDFPLTVELYLTIKQMYSVPMFK